MVTEFAPQNSLQFVFPFLILSVAWGRYSVNDFPLVIDFNYTVAFPAPYRNLRSGLEWSGRDFIIQSRVTLHSYKVVALNFKYFGFINRVFI